MLHTDEFELGDKREFQRSADKWRKNYVDEYGMAKSLNISRESLLAQNDKLRQELETALEAGRRVNPLDRPRRPDPDIRVNPNYSHEQIERMAGMKIAMMGARKRKDYRTEGYWIERLLYEQENPDMDPFQEPQYPRSPTPIPIIDEEPQQDIESNESL